MGMNDEELESFEEHKADLIEKGWVNMKLEVYNVDLETYTDKLIKHIGLYTLDEIKKLAKSYIGEDGSKVGVVFKNEKDIDKNIEYIKEHGNELWLLGNEQQIRIEKVSDGNE